MAAPPVPTDAWSGPRLVVLRGNIGSGKTTLLHSLRNSGWTVIPEPVRKWNYYLTKFYDDPAHYAYLLQMQVILHFHDTTTKLLQRFEADPNAPAVIVERSLMDVEHVFIAANLAAYAPPLATAMATLCHEYEELPMWKNALNVYLQTPWRECSHRMRQRRRVAERTVADSYLLNLEARYESPNIVKDLVLNGAMPPEMLHVRFDLELRRLGFRPTPLPPLGPLVEDED